MEGIPLDSTTDPCSCHTYVCRFYNSVAVKDVVAVCLVYGIEQTASDLRKNTELNVLVLHVETVISDFLTLSGHIVIERVRINASLCSLV